MADTTIEVTPSGSQGAAIQVVSGVHCRVGDNVAAGQVLLAVSGRPLIALLGKVPAYRDLRPGQSGQDVAQLQEALRQLRHYSGGDKRGFFGTATKAAVEKLYDKAGFEAARTGGANGAEELQSLRAAARAVEEADQSVRQLNRLISSGAKPGPGEDSLTVQLSRAEARLAEARRDQRDLISRSGPMVPLSEIAFVPRFPARVMAVNGKVGDTVQSPLLVLSSGKLAVEIKIQPSEASLVRPGAPVRLMSESLGAEAEGTVSSVGRLGADQTRPGTEPGSTASDAPYHLVTVTPTKQLPSQWAGLDIRVTLISARTAGPVLVVPLSAVSSGADSRTTVSVLEASGETRRIDVRVGASGDGFAEIEPATDTLNEGDPVIVGERR